MIREIMSQFCKIEYKQKQLHLDMPSCNRHIGVVFENRTKFEKHAFNYL